MERRIDLRKIDLSVVGAFDRFNYGDMLFPYIIEWFVKQKFSNYTINFYGIRESDFSRYGAKKTKALKELQLDENYVVVAGGDTLLAALEFLYLDNVEQRVCLFLERVLRKLLGKQYHKYLEYKTGLVEKYPYTINYKNTIYNSVGGCGLKEVKEKNKIIKTLEEALYVSVRDAATYNELNSKKVCLNPDSAMLISKIWEAEELDKVCHKDILELKNKKYYVFQINGHCTRSECEKIIRIIGEIYNKEAVVCVLLPLGRTISHNDTKSLKYIYKKTKGRTIIFDDISIQEITWILARSCGFIGTSLHGNLVSLSYGKRTILLAKPNTKNWWYWKTWLENSNCILSTFETLEKDCASLKDNVDYTWINQQKEQVEEHFDKIAECINNTR